jgi:hypothetical protein
LDITNSHVTGSVVTASNLYYSLVKNSEIEDSQIANSCISIPNQWAKCKKWRLSGDRVQDEETYLAFKKRFGGLLSSKVYDYSNREAGDLPRFGAKDFIAGIELEIISDAGVVLYKPSYCRVKRDGSLSEGGVEIVTRPDSIDSHVRNLRRMFSVNHKKYKLKINETCGMHVHIPKTHARVWALKDRIYSNILRYQRIAGRPSNEYCRYQDNGERYQAVNLSDNTIEFRLFSGTMSVHRIKRRLQWIEAICRWSMKQPGRQPRATETPVAEQPPIPSNATRVRRARPLPDYQRWHPGVAADEWPRVTADERPRVTADEWPRVTAAELNRIYAQLAQNQQVGQIVANAPVCAANW